MFIFSRDESESAGYFFLPSLLVGSTGRWRVPAVHTNPFAIILFFFSHSATPSNGSTSPRVQKRSCDPRTFPIQCLSWTSPPVPVVFTTFGSHLHDPVTCPPVLGGVQGVPPHEIRDSPTEGGDMADCNVRQMDRSDAERRHGSCERHEVTQVSNQKLQVLWCVSNRACACTEQDPTTPLANRHAHASEPSTMLERYNPC